MISKQGQERARLLAVELVRVEKENNYKKFEEASQILKEVVTEAWQSIVNVFKKITDAVSESVNLIKDRDKNRENWHMPLDTRLSSQVSVPNIQLPRARSGI